MSTARGADAAALEVAGVDVVAGAGLHALARRVGFRLRRGERLALLGRNGAGKSTLLRQIAGLLPLSGADPGVRIDGSPLPAMRPRQLARLRALMPAQPRDRFNLPIAALLELAQPRLDAGLLDAALRRVDAWELRERDVLALSAGERQRVALAQALVQDCPVLLLDEPVAFQDPGHQRLVGALLAELHDKAVVFCAHDVNWVAQHATHVLGLGLAGEPDATPGWFFAERGRALTAARLEALYGCRWTQIESAGHSAWVPA